MLEPENKRCFAFIDGQNLYHAAKREFQSRWADYDPRALATTVCERNGWHLQQLSFYTGIHDPKHNQKLSEFWNAKLAVIGSRPDVEVVTRPLRYSPEPDRSDPNKTVWRGREKGIDVRIALDIIRGAVGNLYDVALIFSGDQDLAEAADEVKFIARQQQRWIKVASAFPRGNGSQARGIYRTDWVPIDDVTYSACLDHNDYRR